MPSEQEPQTYKYTQFNTLNDKIDETLLNSRRLFFCDAVDNESARDAIRKLWYLEITAPGKPILFIINSPGGAIDSGFAIWDQVKMITSPVTTLVTGLAASMGSILSLCAAPGRRFATPYARFMIHQPSINAIVKGQATDLEIHAKEIMYLRGRLNTILAHHTGKTAEEIDRDTERDNFMSADQSVAYGMIDKVIANRTDAA